MSQATFKSNRKTNQPKAYKPRSAHHSFWADLFAARHPRAHWYLASGVIFCLVIGLVFMPSEEVEAKRKTITINLEPETSSVYEDIAETQDPTVVEAILPQPPSLVWHEQVIRSGDNLTALFKRESLTAADVYRFISSSDTAKSLTKLKPGEAIEFGYDEANQLQQISYNKSALKSLTFTNTGDTFEAEEIIRVPETVKTFRQAIISHSLFVDADHAELPHGLIMELANIFGWDIDFALDIRKGDYFSILYEELYLDGEQIGTGNILAASFTNQGKTFKAIRFTDNQGHSDYYSPDGRVMRKAFLRAPLDFTRVSSNFNPNRLHPVFKTKRPHRGVDYAAPTGTPVYAAGDGKVVAAGYNNANGNYVFIQHGQKYVTKYLHLNKRRVKTGQRVSQRTTIGTVGSTGYATGPHLHYEFLVDGVHRNPRTVALPEAAPIPDSLRNAFFAASTPVIAQLDRLSASQQYAEADSLKKDG